MSITTRNMSKKEKTVIIDCGTYETKYGLHTDINPLKFRTVVGRPRADCILPGQPIQFYVGDDAINKKDELNLIFPIRGGIVVDWAAMKIIWKHIFSILNVNPEESYVVLTSSTFPSKNREKIAQIMFELLKVKGLYVATQASLVLKYYSKTHGFIKSGIMVSSGEGATRVIPYKNNVLITETGIRFGLAGGDITNYLYHFLRSKNVSLSLEDVRYLKENYCKVEPKCNTPIEENWRLRINNDYILPNRTITAGIELFACVEAIFAPKLLEIESFSLPYIIYNLISKYYVHVENIDILCFGGNVLFPGFKDRMLDSVNRFFRFYDKAYVANLFIMDYRTAWWGGKLIENEFSTYEHYMSNKFNAKEWAQ